MEEPITITLTAEEWFEIYNLAKNSCNQEGESSIPVEKIADILLPF